MNIKTCKYCNISFKRHGGSDIPNDECSWCHGFFKDADNESDPVNNPSTRQIGGDHYAKLAIQPMRYSMENGLNALQHTIIKYVTRYKDKGGIEDLHKAAHCVELLIQHELDEAHKRDGWTQEAIKQAAFPSEPCAEATEARMGVVGQSGSTAEHYDQSPDWSQAPEGATHWSPETEEEFAAWYKKEGGRWMEWVSPHGSEWGYTDTVLNPVLIPRPSDERIPNNGKKPDLPCDPPRIPERKPNVPDVSAWARKGSRYDRED